MRESLASLRLVLGAAWRCDRSASLFALAEALGNVLNRLQPLFLGLIVDAVLARSSVSLVIGVTGITAALSLSSLLAGVGTHSRLVLMEKLGQKFDERVALAVGSLPSLSHLNESEFQDQVQVLRDRMGSVGRAYNSLINFINQMTLPLTTMVVAIVTDIRLIALVVVAFAISLTVPLTIRWEEQAEEESARFGRSSEHLSRLFSDPAAGAELRTFRTGDLITRILGVDVLAWRMPDARSQRRSAWLATATSLLYGAVAAAIVVAIVDDADAGRIETGKLVTVLLVVVQLRDVVGAVQLAFGTLAQTLRTVGRFRWVMAYAKRAELRRNGAGAAPVALTGAGIDLEGVTVAYGSGEAPALDDVSLHLEPGTTVAVVGENGAGKSTLVAVLLGLIEPSEGRVLIGGSPLADLDVDSWRMTASGAFQDSWRAELAVRVGIGLGRLEGVDRDELPGESAVMAAARRAHADEVVHQLPHGVGTQLGADWPEGVGLSGGQWQRLALARGMMRETPLLLVLDEPTSALDPATEHRILEAYLEASRRAGGASGITVIVTHRLSTASSADHVVVLERGRVREQGTHDQLLKAGGFYAELFNLQARGYR